MSKTWEHYHTLRARPGGHTTNRQRKRRAEVMKGCAPRREAAKLHAEQCDDPATPASEQGARKKSAA